MHRYTGTGMHRAFTATAARGPSVCVRGMQRWAHSEGVGRCERTEVWPLLSSARNGRQEIAAQGLCRLMGVPSDRQRALSDLIFQENLGMHIFRLTLLILIYCS